MKKFLISIFIAVFINPHLVPQEYKMKFTNPILTGFYPDPSICKAGDDFYLVNSTFAYFPGIPVFHSKDLVNWKQIASVMERPEQMDLEGLGVSRGIFAPAISYNNGIFYIVCTLVGAGGNFVVTAEYPAGDWSNPVFIPEINGIDPSLFFDEDGKAYILYNSVAPDDDPLYEGHRTIRMYEFDNVSLKVKGEEVILVNGGVNIETEPVWIEGPHIYKVNGYYYLMAAEGGTGENHSEVIFRSKSVKGPYEPYEKNPILTQRHLDPARKYPVTSTGHADMVEVKTGEWWAVFLGCRPYPPFEEGYYNTGRETFLAPVEWIDGWPVINPDFEKVQYFYEYPLKENMLPGTIPKSGNFTLFDEFDKDELNLNWLFLRVPKEKWYNLTDNPGKLKIKLRPETCAEKVNPSFIGHRQQHLTCSASASLGFNAASENEKAGLVIFQNEDHFYFLAKSIRDQKHVIELFKSKNDTTIEMEAIASEFLPENQTETEIVFSISANEDKYSFLYGFIPENKDHSSVKWNTIKENVDASFLSTKTAGGFVGAIFGLYTTSLGQPSGNSALFNWFEYKGDDEVYR